MKLPLSSSFKSLLLVLHPNYLHNNNNIILFSNNNIICHFNFTYSYSRNRFDSFDSISTSILLINLLHNPHCSFTEKFIVNLYNSIPSYSYSLSSSNIGFPTCSFNNIPLKPTLSSLPIIYHKYLYDIFYNLNIDNNDNNHINDNYKNYHKIL